MAPAWNIAGYLLKAKEELKSTRPVRLQQERLAQVENSIEERRRQTLEAEIREIQTQVDAKRQLIDSLGRQMEEIQYKEILRQITDQYLVMSQFIRTKTQPPLFWTPYKHNAITRKLQINTNEEINNRIKSFNQQQ
ncbi:pinin/SDK/memA/protein [Gregarina niphandrodes]|uniref:Pinin/SDK/memA/protein n=1 Tax=Gregarina niphandrodes TaxID=110365 RepID=A0A023B3G9_GRENI|nr:pinin/SDK/memA/protein [Gregarina niphandrodes]EZG55520.1 pinin/SDK/memA/protein [Gregarina niphandrodes]|eukprot:XP_011131506.1 pinin/SDK/memA/protein [Gregarina niphandrodes]